MRPDQVFDLSAGHIADLSIRVALKDLLHFVYGTTNAPGDVHDRVVHAPSAIRSKSQVEVVFLDCVCHSSLRHTGDRLVRTYHREGMSKSSEVVWMCLVFVTVQGTEVWELRVEEEIFRYHFAVVFSDVRHFNC